MKQNWTYKKLGECFTNIRNGANIKQFSPADGIPITRIETLSNNVFNRDKLGYANIHSIENYEKYILNEGDILMSHINSAKYLGRAVVYHQKEGENIIHGMNLLRLVPISIMPNFAEYYFKSFHFKKQIAQITKKAVNQASFTTTDLKNVTIPVPSLPTQQRIVSELDLLQSIIDKQQAQLKELDTLAQAVFYDMFGDPVENEKGWEVKKLGEIASFKNGLNYSLNETGKMYYIIGVSDFQSKSEIRCDTKLSTIYTNDAIDNGYLLQDNDILFVRSNGNKQLIARNMLVKTNNLDVTYSGFCIRARIVDEIASPFFINFLLKLPSSHKALTMKGRGCNISNLNQTTLNDFDIIVPPLPLQQSFASKIESIEKQKAAIAQSIAETQKLFDYTMDKYFG